MDPNATSTSSRTNASVDAFGKSPRYAVKMSPKDAGDGTPVVQRSATRDTQIVELSNFFRTTAPESDSADNGSSVAGTDDQGRLLQMGSEALLNPSFDGECPDPPHTPKSRSGRGSQIGDRVLSKMRSFASIASKRSNTSPQPNYNIKHLCLEGRDPTEGPEISGPQVPGSDSCAREYTENLRNAFSKISEATGRYPRLGHQAGSMAFGDLRSSPSGPPPVPRLDLSQIDSNRAMGRSGQPSFLEQPQGLSTASRIPVYSPMQGVQSDLSTMGANTILGGSASAHFLGERQRVMYKTPEQKRSISSLLPESRHLSLEKRKGSERLTESSEYQVPRAVSMQATRGRGMSAATSPSYGERYSGRSGPKGELPAPAGNRRVSSSKAFSSRHGTESESLQHVVGSDLSTQSTHDARTLACGEHDPTQSHRVIIKNSGHDMLPPPYVGATRNKPLPLPPSPRPRAMTRSPKPTVFSPTEKKSLKTHGSDVMEAESSDQDAAGTENISKSVTPNTPKTSKPQAMTVESASRKRHSIRDSIYSITHRTPRTPKSADIDADLSDEDTFHTQDVDVPAPLTPRSPKSEDTEADSFFHRDPRARDISMSAAFRSPALKHKSSASKELKSLTNFLQETVNSASPIEALMKHDIAKEVSEKMKVVYDYSDAMQRERRRAERAYVGKDNFERRPPSQNYDQETKIRVTAKKIALGLRDIRTLQQMRRLKIEKAVGNAIMANDGLDTWDYVNARMRKNRAIKVTEMNLGYVLMCNARLIRLEHLCQGDLKNMGEILAEVMGEVMQMEDDCETVIARGDDEEEGDGKKEGDKEKGEDDKKKGDDKEEGDEKKEEKAKEQEGPPEQAQSVDDKGGSIVGLMTALDLHKTLVEKDEQDDEDAKGEGYGVRAVLYDGEGIAGKGLLGQLAEESVDDDEQHDVANLPKDIVDILNTARRELGAHDLPETGMLSVIAGRR